MVAFYGININSDGSTSWDLVTVDGEHIIPPIPKPPISSGIESTITASKLMLTAETFRERAFVRNFDGLHRDEDGNVKIYLRINTLEKQWDTKQFTIKPRNYTVKMLMGACNSNKEIRQFLAKQGIVGRFHGSDTDPELCQVLQDLADVLAQEGTDAFKKDYYPGIPDVVVPEEHIDVVIAAMQREVDREAKRVNYKPATYSTLPRDRQRALVERRRWWYAKFGITPRTWKKGLFSLWKISNEKIDEYEDWVKFNSFVT